MKASSDVCCCLKFQVNGGVRHCLKLLHVRSRSELLGHVCCRCLGVCNSVSKLTGVPGWQSRCVYMRGYCLDSPGSTKGNGQLDRSLAKNPWAALTLC